MRTHLQLLLIALCLEAAPASAEPAVSQRKLADSIYELTVTVPGTTDVADAQRFLVPYAAKACGGQPYQFGHYAFDSTEKMSVGPPVLPKLTLKQEVRCGYESGSTSGRKSYDWSPTEADSHEVARRTAEFLAQKDRGQLKVAYDQFSDLMKESAHFESWSVSVQAFRTKAGKVEFRKIQKVSWVKDPQGVAPGFYAAVDYTGRFANVPFECGYVAWYRDSKGILTIMREEDGYIDEESRTKMTSEEIAQTLARFGCVGG